MERKFKTCPYCKEKIPEEETACPYCCSNLIEPVTPQPTGSHEATTTVKEEHSPQKGGSKTCPYCCSEIAEDATFCPYCGERQPIHKNHVHETINENTLTGNDNTDGGRDNDSEAENSDKDDTAENETKLCPYCGEPIAKDEVVCPYCGESLPTTPPTVPDAPSADSQIPTKDENYAEPEKEPSVFKKIWNFISAHWYWGLFFLFMLIIRINKRCSSSQHISPETEQVADSTTDDSAQLDSGENPNYDSEGSSTDDDTNTDETKVSMYRSLVNIDKATMESQGKLIDTYTEQGDYYQFIYYLYGGELYEYDPQKEHMTKVLLYKMKWLNCKNGPDIG